MSQQVVTQVLAWIREQLGETAPAQGSELTIDSRRVLPGDVFLAIKGAQSDGRDFIGRAITQGARAILYEADDAQGKIPHPGAERPVPMLAVENLGKLAAAIAVGYYGSPSAQLKVIAITGTNGKTTCAHWIAQGLHLAGHKAAVIGTLGATIIGEADAGFKTGLTTPDAVALQSILARFVRQAVGFVVMEASSIGLEQGRMEGLQIDTAVFTNFTQDHLDYHGTMQAYLDAKKILFRWPKLSNVVLNWDDEQVKDFREVVQGGVKLYGYSAQDNTYRNPESEWVYASPMSPLKEGMMFNVTHQKRKLNLKLSLMGRFNVSNVVAVMATWIALGLSFEQAHGLVSKLTPVLGRMQLIAQEGRPLVIVDYAHTPDAISQALDSLRPAALLRGGKLWIVFGAGGNRDDSKRPHMGGLAEMLADVLVITSDNPRFERPFRIIADLRAGLLREPWLTEPDRRLAIEQALRAANVRDIVLVAGKGHENYQEIEGVKHAFSDVGVVKEILASLPAIEPPVQTVVETGRTKKSLAKLTGGNHA